MHASDVGRFLRTVKKATNPRTGIALSLYLHGDAVRLKLPPPEWIEPRSLCMSGRCVIPNVRSKLLPLERNEQHGRNGCDVFIRIMYVHCNVSLEENVVRSCLFEVMMCRLLVKLLFRFFSCFTISLGSEDLGLQIAGGKTNMNVRTYQCCTGKNAPAGREMSFLVSKGYFRSNNGETVFHEG